VLTEQRIVVLNFDATVMSSRQMREAATARVRDAQLRGEMPLVVCSPMATAAGGEIVWSSRLVDALTSIGVRAVTVTRYQASVEFLRQLLEQEIVPVTTGAHPHGTAAAEGNRYGSDLAALTFAEALHASSVIVYADIDGVMTADPKRVDGAVRVERVGYVELMELAGRDPQLIDPAAADLARTNGTHYEIRGIETDRGTSVRADGHVERSRPVTAIMADSEVALISVRIPTARALAHDALLERFAQHDLAIEMLQFLPNGARFACERSRLGAIREQLDALEVHSRVIERCAKLWIVGTGIRNTSGIMYRILRTLQEHNITALHFSDSNITISLIVAESNMAAAEKALHDEFALNGGQSIDMALHFDVTTGYVRVRGRDVRLGERQARLLRLLLDNAGKIVEVEQAADAVFGARGKDEINALRVHVHTLRKKLEEDAENPRYLITIPNKGYLFVR
jgi:Amino acid kinase family/Transcriptional regulatory protein, C terminal/ACT domain